MEIKAMLHERKPKWEDYIPEDARADIRRLSDALQDESLQWGTPLGRGALCLPLRPLWWRGLPRRNGSAEHKACGRRSRLYPYQIFLVVVPGATLARPTRQRPPHRL